MGVETGMATVTKNDRRYEIEVDGTRVGFADYRVDGGVVTIPRTEVVDAYSGRGLAGELVRHALDDVRAQGLTVDPACPYVASWISRHPDYADLLARR